MLPYCHSNYLQPIGCYSVCKARPHYRSPQTQTQTFTPGYSISAGLHVATEISVFFLVQHVVLTVLFLVPFVVRLLVLFPSAKLSAPGSASLSSSFQQRCLLNTALSSAHCSFLSTLSGSCCCVGATLFILSSFSRCQNCVVLIVPFPESGLYAPDCCFAGFLLQSCRGAFMVRIVLFSLCNLLVVLTVFFGVQTSCASDCARTGAEIYGPGLAFALLRVID